MSRRYLGFTITTLRDARYLFLKINKENSKSDTEHVKLAIFVSVLYIYLKEVPHIKINRLY